MEKESIMKRKMDIDTSRPVTWLVGVKFLLGPLAVIVGTVEAGGYDVSVRFYLYAYIGMVVAWTVFYFAKIKGK